MSRSTTAGAVIYAKNVALVSAFYAATAGFDVTHEEADHVVLETPAFQPVVLAIPQAIASSFDMASPPVRRAENPVKLVFFVPSIGAARKAAVRLGGELNPPEQEWRFGIAWSAMAMIWKTMCCSSARKQTDRPFGPASALAPAA